MSVMCSHESIAWEITDNSVTDRMIDNSLIHKFRPSRKLRRRTKVLNTEVKKHYGMTDYKHYVELKTNVLRNLANDTDTDDNSSLTDVDYDIIYSSPSKQAKYVAENSKRHIFSSEEDCEGCKRKSIKYQMESRDSRTKRHVQTRKSSRMKYSMVSKKRTNVGWQEVTKKNSIIPYLRKQVHISDNEEKDNNCNNFKAQSSKRSLSSQLDSPNSTTSIKNYRNGYMRQNHESNAMNNKLNSENSTMSNETKSVTEKKIQNHRNQSATGTESNILVKSKDNSSNKLTAISNRSSIKNYDNKNINHKSELLKNVKRNLIPALEKVDSINNDKDIEINENTEDGLNYDQLLSASNINFNRDTTLRKTQTDIPTIKNVSLDISSLDQQKDSGIDEDSQDRFVKIKESNEIATNHNMEENAEKILIFSPELKSDQVIETAQDYEEDEKDAHLKYSNDILIDQTSKEFSGEEKMKNSSQLNQIDLNVEINQEDKEDEYFARTEDSNDLQKQQSLSPKQDCMKDTHSEFYNHVQEEEDDRKMQNSSEEEEISLQLTVSSINSKDTEVSSINREGEGERQVNKEKEEKDFSQLNEADKDVKTHSINQEDKTYMKLENTHNVEKKQILPKVMYTEILSKKYKIIKKDNDVKSNETIDNINNNTDVANKDTPTKRNTSLCYSDIGYDTDNWQETTEEIDASITLETDNEEINVNYISPQTKKRLQQQARLNLVENSDSSDSDDECITTKISQKFIDNADTNRCSENDILKDDETNSDSKQTNSYVPIKNTLISTEVVKLDSTNVKEGIKKKAESLRYKNNDLFQFTTNENPLKETQYYEKVHNNDRNEDDSFQLKVSESNVSYNNEESINQFRNHKHSPLSNKKYMYTESNENEEIVRAEYEHNAQTSTKSRSNAHINISCQYRPSNLQELVEDQELLVETMPTSLTLADLSENEEAFILNVPSKVVQCNLQGQMLTLKEKSIKFNENKYRIVQKEVGTTSCIFATGKKRKPYKIKNIKKISTVTVREKLPQDSKKRDVSYSYSAVSSTKLDKNEQSMNEQIDEVDLKNIKSF